MSNSSGFERGVIAGILVAIGASAINWLITPMNHPDASMLHNVGVAIQAIVGLGVGIWLIFRERMQRTKAGGGAVKVS